MFKKIVLSAILALAMSPLWAAGPAQQLRIDFTGAEEGNIEVSEIEFRSTAGGDSVIQLFKNHTHEQAVGNTSWSILHGLKVQRKNTTVDVVAYSVADLGTHVLGDYYYNTVLFTLQQLGVYGLLEVPFTNGATGAFPAEKVDGDIFHDTDLDEWHQWDEGGSSWVDITASVSDVTQASELPTLTVVEADTTTLVPGAGNAASGGPAANIQVDLEFPEATFGSASVRGPSFDHPAASKRGDAIPVIVGYENRPAAAAFDGNKGSYFKSKRAPTFNSPLTLQYTYWVGDPANFPNVVEYAITAKDKESAPKSWTVMILKEGQWIQVDQQAAMRFEDGETRVFDID